MKGTPKNLRSILLYQNAIIAEKLKQMCSTKDKQVASKLFRGNILRKYGLGKAANREFGFSAKAIRANQYRPTNLQYSRKKQCNRISIATEENITR